MNTKTVKYVLFSVVVVAAVLRLWSLGTNPPHLTPDEAALGYNAYSILKTGRDEYGELLPIIFKSFGDYKPGLYVYFAVPTVALLGLTEFAVRLPSALAGIAAVWLMYKIVFEFACQKDTSTKNPVLLALLASFALALSPWHIHFSRGAWEVNLALTLTLAGIYLFLKSLDKITNLYWSALFFSLTLITYQGAKLSVLIVLLILLYVYFDRLKSIVGNTKNAKHILLAALIGTIIALPIFHSFTSGQTGRLKVFSIFSYQRPPEYLAEQLDHAQIQNGSPSYYLFYSENLNTLRGLMGRWFNHYSGRFLIFEGDWQNLRHQAPDTGMMHIVDIIFLILGMGVMYKYRNGKSVLFFLLWFILAPLPAVLSRDQVHAVRAFNMVIPLTVIIAHGVYYLLSSIQKYKYFVRLATYSLLLTAYIGSLGIYLDNYFIHQPIHNSKFWEYGYKQIVEVITPIQTEYETIHVQQSYSQPYIYFLFYQKYDPARYQRSAHLTESKFGDVGTVDQLDNIVFNQIDWARDRGDEGTLFVTDPINVPPQDSSDPKYFRIIKEIPYLDPNQTAFRIIEVLDQEVAETD